MESLRSAVMCACMMSCAAGLVSLVTPEKTLARQMKFLLSLLFALSLAVPLLHLELPAGITRGDTAFLTVQMQERLNEQVLSETKRRLEAILQEALTERGITCRTLTAEVHIDEDGCIYISRVAAECDDFAAACAALSDLLGEGGDYEVTQILGDAD